ncbi:MAG: PilN domain-containing protein [bacterium]|nr:PilN domain-containing protein [bacterium]
MADRPEAIQLLSGSRRKLEVAVPGENKPIYFGLAFVAVVVAIYFAVFFYLGNLQSQVETLDNEITALENKRDKKFEQEALVLSKRLSLAGDLTKNHLIWSAAFDRIEAITPPSVQFTNLQAILQETRIEIQGTAPSYTVIAKSIAALLADPVFLDVDVNKVSSLPSGLLEYSMRIAFDKNKFLLNPVKDKP